MKRLENYQNPCNNDTHGYDGPIAISNGGQVTPVAQDFLRASHAIGIPYSGMPYYYSDLCTPRLSIHSCRRYPRCCVLLIKF